MATKKKLTTKGKGKIVFITGTIRGKIAAEIDPRFAVDFEEPALQELGLGEGSIVDFYMIPTDPNPELYLAIAVRDAGAALLEGSVSSVNTLGNGGEIEPVALKKSKIKFKQKHLKKLGLKKGSKVKYLPGSDGKSAICVHPIK
jgi:hypothetical protein